MQITQYTDLHASAFCPEVEAHRCCTRMHMCFSTDCVLEHYPSPFDSPYSLSPADYRSSVGLKYVSRGFRQLVNNAFAIFFIPVAGFLGVGELAGLCRQGS